METIEFRTAVAAAAFAINSIENKEQEIKQDPNLNSKPKKSLSGNILFLLHLKYNSSKKKYILKFKLLYNGHLLCFISGVWILDTTK